ncbi:unnamed protein product [Clavelina lepadiformis]|uniref:Suppressor of white apricot N-terminal domain-containing protein n=1 Tax=Clavelina lepadiformis TaxID=159417 RepID=A0ABP0GNK7_CLALP
MWHEARKQEKVLRKVIVDYRRRAERRHEYYDKIKQDPTKFMQVHGKRCKLFIDETNQSSDSCHMMPWQGDKSNMIDRFDVRAHLDFINEPKPSNQTKSLNDKEERRLNYERYRILVYNKHKNVSESQHLHKIHVNESYPDLNAQKLESEAKKQQLATTKASIGFDYGADVVGGAAEVEEEDSSDSDEDFMFDLEDIPPLRELNPDDLEDIEKFSLDFGMGYTDFVRSMDQDQEMQERIDKAREVESEKQKMAGKKSRRERRMLRDERLKDRVIGPLSYMQKGSGNESETESESSDEEHPSCEGKIEFITSFGADKSVEFLFSAATLIKFGSQDAAILNIRSLLSCPFKGLWIISISLCVMDNPAGVRLAANGCS